MLDPWIIEEILKKEEEKRQQERGHAELPLPVPRPRDTGPHSTVTPPREEGERGVMIIDI
jgi:hypothetical protein